MITLITGGTGFLGSHLVDGFLRSGHQVRCLVRSRSSLGWLDDKDVELVEGDCTKPDSLIPALRGVDLVVHAAGATWAARRSVYFKVNATGTRNLLRACAAEVPNLRRFLHISSQAAAGPAPVGQVMREQDPPRPISPYGESKLLAERHVAAYKELIPCVILRPSTVYGPRDRNLLTYIRMVKRGFLIEFGLEPRELSLCHVEDLVSGVLTAADRQVSSGSVYYLADAEPYAWSEVDRLLCAALGVDARRVIVPQSGFKALALAGQFYGLVSNRPVRINALRAAELLAKRWVCDVTKARKELGYASKKNLTQGLQQLIRWYEQQYWL